MKISVIVPVYNAEKYIQQCINSIVEQDYRKREIILVNDGSTDRSGELCDNFARIHSEIRVIHIKNGGAANARRVGLENSTGELISFVDADDSLRPGALSILYLAMSSDIDVVIGAQIVVAGGKCKSMHILNEEFSREEYVSATLHHHRLNWAPYGKLFRRELFDENSFPHLINCEDLLMTLELSRRVRRVRAINRRVYYYVQHEGSVSHQFKCTVATEQHLCNLIEESLRSSGMWESAREAYYHFAFTRLYICIKQRHSIVSYRHDEWVRAVYSEARRLPLSFRDRLRFLSLRYTIIRLLIRGDF